MSDATHFRFPARVKILRNRFRNLDERLSASDSEGMIERVGETRVTTKPAASGVAGPAPAVGALKGIAPQPDVSLASLRSPDMSAKVEIITGRRTVLDFILSPISKATHEAGGGR